jgi:hypothetical protein
VAHGVVPTVKAATSRRVRERGIDAGDPLRAGSIGCLFDLHVGVRAWLVEERETELLDRLRKREIELLILRLALFGHGRRLAGRTPVRRAAPCR